MALDVPGHNAALVTTCVDRDVCEYDLMPALVCSCGADLSLGDAPGPLEPFVAFLDHVVAEGTSPGMVLAALMSTVSKLTG